jgi:hypothetical protein
MTDSFQRDHSREKQDETGRPERDIGAKISPGAGHQQFRGRARLGGPDALF